jgi:murein DD-endopeptidase MepM/ murein hydrolase activator NlpD
MTFSKSLTIFILLLTSLQGSFAAINNNEVVSDDKINVFEMKRRMSDQAKNLKLIGKEVKDVEYTLGLNNKKYLKLAQDRAEIEEGLSRAKKSADLDSDSLKKSYNQAKSLLMGVLLNKLEKTENPSDMLARKIMIEKLNLRLSELTSMMNANKQLRIEVETLEERLADSMRTEKELLTVMNELENRKRELRDSMSKEESASQELKKQFDDEKNKLALNRKSQLMIKEKEKLAPMQITEEIKIPSVGVASSGEYFPPVFSYQGLEYDKKGVTFNFQGKVEVRATKAGKIVYTGSLANYGNVLMIDHGNDTRTVLLGQFDFSVKNGDSVNQSQVVGYTSPKSYSALSEGKIYFEVRKSNLAQNTYLLLDKKSLARKSSN